MFPRERVPSNREPHLPAAHSTGEQVRRPPGWARFGTEMETAPSSTLDDLGATTLTQAPLRTTM